MHIGLFHSIYFDFVQVGRASVTSNISVRILTSSFNHLFQHDMHFSYNSAMCDALVKSLSQLEQTVPELLYIFEKKNNT